MGRRTLVVIAILAALVLGVFLGRTHRGDTAAGPPEASPTAVIPTAAPAPDEITPAPAETELSEAEPGPGETPYSQTEQARRQWGPVVEGFGRGFVATQDTTAGAWRKALRPYVTKAVDRQLATVDLGNVPRGHYGGFEALKFEENQLVVRIDYREGWSTAAYLIFDGGAWRVYAYDRWEE
jgi:hypothetical protein